MRAHLRAGVAIYNAGEYHAAHDAWEDHWLDLASGTDDELFLHGLIQFTAAVYHTTEENWSGARGLAESGGEYLAGLPADYRDVNVGAVRRFLADLAEDPHILEDREPLALSHEGVVLALSDLDLDATCVAARVLAEEHGYDEAVIERASEYARTDDDEADRTGSPVVPLLFDFVREPEHREIAARRLSEHVRRRASRDADVDGLFD